MENKYPLFFVLFLFRDYFLYYRKGNTEYQVCDELLTCTNIWPEEKYVSELPEEIEDILEYFGEIEINNKISTDKYISFLKGVTRANLYLCYKKANFIINEVSMEKKSNSHITNTQLTKECSVEFLYTFAYYVAEFISESEPPRRNKHYKEVAAITKPNYYDEQVKIRVKKMLDMLSIYTGEEENVSSPLDFKGFLISMFHLTKSKDMASIIRQVNVNNQKKKEQVDSQIYFDLLRYIHLYTLLLVETYINDFGYDYNLELRELFGCKEVNYQRTNREKILIHFFDELKWSLPDLPDLPVKDDDWQQVDQEITIDKLITLYPNLMLSYAEALSKISIDKKLKLMESVINKVKKSKIIENNMNKYDELLNSNRYVRIDFSKLGESQKINKFWDILNFSILEDVYEN